MHIVLVWSEFRMVEWHDLNHYDVSYRDLCSPYDDAKRRYSSANSALGRSIHFVASYDALNEPTQQDLHNLVVASPFDRLMNVVDEHEATQLKWCELAKVYFYVWVK